MKWRHWSILLILVLLNYIIFSTAFTQLAKQRQPTPCVTRTPCPTFESVEPSPVAWIVLPTSTAQPTKAPITLSPVPTMTSTEAVTATAPLTVTIATADTATPVPPTATAAAPTVVPTTATAAGEAVVHVVKRGETLSEIAKTYGVSVQAIVDANGIEDANRIVTGQKLVIPVSGEFVPTATARSQASNTPKPKATQRPPTATPAPPASSQQFTGEIIWDPLVAPNCNGPAISRHSIIRNTNGDPVNGVRVEVDCYGNQWLSHPSGNPGEYDPGHYDFSFGQTVPQEWTCSVRIVEIDGQPVASSQVISVHFDTNNCKPHGDGHQVAIVNWTKHW